MCDGTARPRTETLEQQHARVIHEFCTLLASGWARCPPPVSPNCSRITRTPGRPAHRTPPARAISGGNPLLIRALLEDHARAAGRISAKAPAGPVVADAFREAVLVCVHRYGPDVLEGAQGLAVLDDAGTPALLARLLDIEPPQADHVVEVLTMAGLLADDHFRHPAARAAVLDNIARKDRTRLHRRAAELLYQEGAQATTVAAHLITPATHAAANSPTE
ncbi:hypothetical protein ACFT8W_09610 [Streptomyces hygroscopicus]|uniref:hypothetical protein n=1 Tax=Streptomyces hygroscopicus TaxID=1912 RepID=UPI00362AC3CF